MKNILKKLVFWGLMILIIIFILFFLIWLIGLEIIITVLVISFPFIVIGIALYRLKQPSMTMRRAISVGIILGFILVVAKLVESSLSAISDGERYFTALGNILFLPIDLLTFYVFYSLSVDIQDISIAYFWVFAYTLVFIVSISFSLLTYLSFKHFVRKEKNKNTKYIMAADIFFIGLVFLSSAWFLFRSVCLAKADCATAVAEVDDRVCQHVPYNTGFIFDEKNYYESFFSYESGSKGCYAKLAVIHKNEAFCAKQSNSNHQSSCYMQLSRVVPDMSLCQKIDYLRRTDYMDEKDYCFKNVAASTGDISKCELISTGSDLKELCFAIIKNDKSYCDKIKKYKNEPYKTDEEIDEKIKTEPGSYTLYGKSKAWVECQNHFK